MSAWTRRIINQAPYFPEKGNPALASSSHNYNQKVAIKTSSSLDTIINYGTNFPGKGKVRPGRAA